MISDCGLCSTSFKTIDSSLLVIYDNDTLKMMILLLLLTINNIILSFLKLVTFYLGGISMSISFIIAAFFVVYTLQSILSWFQLKKVYQVIDDLKKQHRGKTYYLATGSGKKKFFVVSKGVFIILIADENNTVIDYYSMEGYSVFASPKQQESYLGMHLYDILPLLKRKNQKKAFLSTIEQLEMLRKQADAGNTSSKTTPINL